MSPTPLGDRIPDEVGVEKVQLVVVGAGVAGTSSAIEAARAGLEVTLIDEHPIDFSLMAQDIPLHFGQRMVSTVANKASMLGRMVAANPLLQEAEEAGVNLQLGTIVWSSDADRTLGLADGNRSWLLGYDRAIFAPGARDLGMAFQGWDKAEVMGAGAALALINRYQGFSGQRLVILGSGDLGLSVAWQVLQSGVEVAGKVDVSCSVRGRTEFKARLEHAGVPFYTSYTVKEAIGPGEVSSLVISRIGDGMQPVSGSDKDLSCDTVCLAIGLVPNIELIQWAGCELQFQPQRGGFVPRVDQGMRTTVESIYVVGDGAGFIEDRFPDPDIAAVQGRIAALSAAASLGVRGAQVVASLRERVGSRTGVEDDSRLAYLQAWVTSLKEAGGLDVPVCLCEGVTRRDLSQMIGRGPVHPDHIKRITRAGMGYCQGRRCREQIQMLVAEATSVEVAQVPLASYRPPFRPLPLGVIQNQEETPEEREAFEGMWRRRRLEYLRRRGYKV